LCVNLGYQHALDEEECLVAEKSRAEYMIWKNFTKKSVKNGRPAPLLRVSKESFLLGPMGWAIRGDIDFILQSYLDILFLNFRDFGFQAKTLGEFRPVLGSRMEKEPATALGMETIQVLFYFLMTAHLLNALVLVLEIGHFSIMRNVGMRTKEQKENTPLHTFLP
jgi:hypothetical protein